jgi:hypothetical protein
LTPEAFRAALADLGMTQAGFARFLVAHGYAAAGVDRRVRDWCDTRGAPAWVPVVLALLRARQ